MAEEPEALTSTPHKRYKLVQPAWTTTYTYIADSAPSHKTAVPLFVVDVCSFKRNTPNLILHCGSDRKISPAVACSWVLATSRSSKIGLGDVHNKPDHILWEDFKQETFWATEFSWGMDFEDRREELRWKTTSHHAVDGKKAKSWSAGYWKLVSKEDNNRILCVFTRASGLTTVCGTLQFNVDWGTHFEHMVLLTVAYL